ncbi:MAG: hypothetical protein ACRC3Z_12815 [Phocaeicola sp.]
MKLLHWSKIGLKSVACAALLLSATPAQSQQVTVDASIDSLTLLIGEQAKVKLEISLDADKTLQLPLLKDTLVRGVEVLDVAKPDTQYLNDRKRMLITQEYTITSFDSALYYLPPLEILVNNESYRSQALALKVYSIPVDTLNPEAFFGPKTIRKVSLTWGDVSTMVWLLLLMIALGAFGYYLFMRWIDNKPIIRKIKVEPKIPPHQLALNEIERIKGDKSLRANDPKAYYTELTDVLRTYMEERFGFSALEMTSSEIIEHLKKVNEKESVRELMSLFQTADLVKFAKHAPLMNENDMNLVNAVEFINETKVEVDPNAKPEPTEITVVEKRSKTGTMWLIATMATVGVTLVVVLYFLARDIYRLWF